MPMRTAMFVGITWPRVRRGGHCFAMREFCSGEDDTRFCGTFCPDMEWKHCWNWRIHSVALGKRACEQPLHHGRPQHAQRHASLKSSCACVCRCATQSPRRISHGPTAPPPGLPPPPSPNRSPSTAPSSWTCPTPGRHGGTAAPAATGVDRLARVGARLWRLRPRRCL